MDLNEFKRVVGELLNNPNNPVIGRDNVTPAKLTPLVFAQIERVCIECGRKFDIANKADADEWYSGHDCESE